MLTYIREKLSGKTLTLPVVILHSSTESKRLREVIKNDEWVSGLIKPVNTKNIIAVLMHFVKHKKQNERIPNEQSVEAIIPEHDTLQTGSRPIIMIAEDNPSNMLYAKTVISSLLHDVEIIEAENGKDAVRLSRMRNPDIIFMDIRMPLMNGYDATREIRKVNSQTKIIALTANAIKEERERCMEAGMNDYLTKPVTYQDFRKTLEKYRL